MTEPISESSEVDSLNLPGVAPIFSKSDRSMHVERCTRLLANRRRRFCLYYLHRANTPLPVENLARLVEVSVTPPEASITERVFEEAVHRLADTHLPKLHDAGLVQTGNGTAELTSDPPVPVLDWLAVIAAVELDPVETERFRSERTTTEGREGDNSASRDEWDTPLSFPF